MDYTSMLKTFLLSFISSSISLLVIYLSVIKNLISQNNFLKNSLKEKIFQSDYLIYFSVKSNDIGDDYHPISLTKEGKIVYYDSTGYHFLYLYRKELIDKIKSLNPKSPYDVQTYAVDVLKEVSNDDSFNLIKTYAFKNGMDLDIIIRIMSIPLRHFALNELNFKIN